MTRRYPLGFFTIGLSLAAAPLAGQAQARHPARGTAADSARLVEAARDAQRDLERTRRQHLSRTFTSYGPCDVRIGFYCYWLYTDDPKPPRPDPPELVAARDRLLALLDSAVRWETDGRWSRGQRVRYLVEDGDLTEAARAATGCGPAVAWWCPALRGYVAHVAGDFRLAEAAYDTALTLMPAEQRCEWEDISDLMSGDLRGRYRDLDCDDRTAYQRQLLWLADPLVIVAGNELWTEHLTRHVYAELRRNSHGVEGARWNATRYQGLIRYGRPVWWEQDIDRRFGAAAGEGIITHHSPNGRYYFPRLRDAQDLAAISDDAWELRWRRAPSTHSPGHDAAHLDRVRPELTYWPMGDSTGIIAFVEIEDDSLAPGDSLRVLLAASTGPEAGWSMRDTVVSTRRTALDLVVPTVPQLVTVEALAPSRNRAGRDRFGIDPAPAGDLAVSDLLVVRGADSLPATRQEAMQRLDPAPTFRAGDALHLYWELYSRPNEPVPVQASLRLLKTGRSFLRRVAELTPFASQGKPISLSWRELTQPTHGLYRWALEVTLPVEVSAGRYTFTLEVETRDGDRFERKREIEIVR